MSFTFSNPEDYEGQAVGNGQCVAFVRESSGAPPSSSWTEGVKARGANVAVGTIIATFVDGVYPNNASGNHAAVYVSQDAHGLTVWDQWTGQPVHKRVIQFRGGQGSMSNDGDSFSVVEGANPLDEKLA